MSVLRVQVIIFWARVKYEICELLRGRIRKKPFNLREFRAYLRKSTRQRG